MRPLVASESGWSTSYDRFEAERAEDSPNWVDPRTLRAQCHACPLGTAATALRRSPKIQTSFSNTITCGGLNHRKKLVLIVPRLSLMLFLNSIFYWSVLLFYARYVAEYISDLQPTCHSRRLKIPSQEQTHIGGGLYMLRRVQKTERVTERWTGRERRRRGIWGGSAKLWNNLSGAILSSLVFVF